MNSILKTLVNVVLLKRYGLAKKKEGTAITGLLVVLEIQNSNFFSHFKPKMAVLATFL